MLTKLEGYFQGNWKIVFVVFFAPLFWVSWLFQGDVPVLCAKLLFLLLPAVLLVAGLWSTIISLATVVFRPNRITFIALLLITWWDAGKAIFLYWIGLLRFAFLSLGWGWGILRVIILGTYYTAREILFFPFTLLRNTASNYFKPGIPWIAVVVSFLWIIMEAFIFSYVLTPMATDVMGQLVDNEPNRAVVTFVLFLFLFVVIGGSFACMDGLVKALEKKQIMSIIKMLVIEFFVMFIEVVFFYREFVDSLAPWIAQMTNDTVHLGLFSMLGIATFAWVGVRAGTWFFFGKYGTPVLLNIISREVVTKDFSHSPTMLGFPVQWLKHLVESLQKEINWFTLKGNEMVEAFVLPPVQILAAITNFCMVLLVSKNLFNLPIKSLKDVKDTKELIDHVVKEK
ncbi:MAG: hypothetical protein WCG27_06905 [Pseudomonadota bacterium]